jgi:hypothetical protein
MTTNMGRYQILLNKGKMPSTPCLYYMAAVYTVSGVVTPVTERRLKTFDGIREKRVICPPSFVK